jgi:hypothetical protein
MSGYLKAMRDANEIARRSSALGPYLRDDPALTQLAGLDTVRSRPAFSSSCQNAKVVEAFCSRRVHHRDRHQHTIPIALAALPGAILPATSCIGAFWTPAS